MLNVLHVPNPPLSHFIDHLWVFGDCPAHARERIVPSATFELVINLVEDEIRIYDPLVPGRFRRYSGAVVSGTFRGFFVIDTREHASIMGVHFKPGGAYPFLRMPAHHLLDAHVDLSNIWGTHAGVLREQLCGAKTSAARFSLLEAALLERLVRIPERPGAVQAGLSWLGRTAVRDVVDRVGLSHRRFIDVFTREVGLTPKLFGRVRRFQEAMARSQGMAGPRWARLAQDCGYYDQSHLVRDFLAFSGLTPDAYLQLRTPRVKTNHIPAGEGPSKSSNTEGLRGGRVRRHAEPDTTLEAEWNR